MKQRQDKNSEEIAYRAFRSRIEDPCFERTWADAKREFVDYYVKRLGEENISLYPGRVLSVGSGTGYHEIELKKRGVDVVGIDYSEEISSVACALCDRLGLPPLFSQGDITTRTAFEDDSFDYVLCTQVLHHIRDVDSALIEVHRVLKPGGAVIILELNCYNPLRLISAVLISLSIRLPRPFWIAGHRNEGFHPNWKLSRALRKNGFAEICQIPLHQPNTLPGLTSRLYRVNYRVWERLGCPVVGSIDTIYVARKGAPPHIGAPHG
jgi:SAM-dependent methyltransferase